MNRREQIIDYLKGFFETNADRHKIEMVFLYGSWASGLARLDSDIDIAIVFSREVTDEEVFRCLTDSSLALSRSLHTEVNVIAIHRDFREPMLYYNAIVLGLPVFLREFNRYLQLKNQAIYHMEDFGIFGRNWQLSVAKRNLGVVKRA